MVLLRGKLTLNVRAAVQLPVIEDFDGERPTRHPWALARRSISRPDEIAYYLGYAPVGTGVDRLVSVAGRRWAIEECLQAAKNEFGLDQYEVRRYVGWTRHITLATLAHASLAVTAAQAAPKGAAETVPPLVALTVAEVRRLPAAVLAHRPRPPLRIHAMSWSRWRRRRQAVARHCHYGRRRHSLEAARQDRP